MSDARVRASIEQMEAWLSDLNWVPDPAALAKWDAEFKAALAKAEKAPGWPDLIERAHAAGLALEARSEVLAEERDEVGVELGAQARGTRALKGYEASTR